MAIFSIIGALSLVEPNNAVIGGKAIQQSLALFRGNSPFPAPFVIVEPYVKKIALSNIAKTGPSQFDNAGRQQYACGTAFGNLEQISDTLSGLGLAVALDALFNFQGNIYTYRFNVVDVGGTYDCSYYSAGSTDAGYPDLNGNLKDFPIGLDSKNPFGYVPPVPTGAQRIRYQNSRLFTDLATPNRNVIFFPSILNVGFNPTTGKTNKNAKGGGLAIGMTYNPGGLDPNLVNMHWIQIGASTNPIVGKRVVAADDGTQDNFPQQTAPDGNPWIFFDDISKFGDLKFIHYDTVGGGPTPVANTSYFLDEPFNTVGFPFPNPDGPNGFQINNSLFVKSIPTDHLQTFFLFKMWYDDASGNPVPGPIAGPGNIVGLTISRQGVQYGYRIVNYNPGT